MLVGIYLPSNMAEDPRRTCRVSFQE